MKSNDTPTKLFAHRNEDDGGWTYGKRRKEPNDPRFPYVSAEDAVELMVIALDIRTLTVAQRRLIRRLAGVGGR